FEPNNPPYNSPRTLRMTGTLNVEALEKSLNEIVQRHESQRTTFATVNGHAVQVVAPSLAIPLTLVDISGLPENEREGEARRLAAQEALQPLDITTGPLLRAKLLRFTHVDHVVLITLLYIARQ